MALRMDVSGTGEPTVIDDELIRACVHYPPSTDQQGQVRNDEEKRRQLPVQEFRRVECLIFSFKNIAKISNLQGFEGLTKLQLDNNIIQKIEGIEHLVNLKWLDLSFNNIKAIENLDTLSKLEVLSLFTNQIEKIEKMDTLTNMQVLSIGNNKIHDLDNLMYLRRFKALRTVNIAGNPVCDDPEWRNFVLAHLRSITYLDYRLVDESDVNQAREQYQDELLALEETEAEEATATEERKKKEAELATIREANLGEIDQLFADMYKDDADYARLKCLSVLIEPLEEYRERFETLTEDFKQFILKQHGAKNEEIKQFQEAIQIAKKDNEAEGMKTIVAFEKENKAMLREIRGGGEFSAEHEPALRTLRDKNDLLRDELMEVEMQLSEQFEDVIREFERSMSDIASSNTETIQAYFSKLRDLENSFHETVTMLAMQDWDKYSRQAMDRETSEEERTLLMDKDGLVNALNGSHDSRMAKIDIKEDEMASKEQRSLDTLITKTKSDETARDRARVAEIWVLWSRTKTEIDEILVEDDGDL